jgi:hypothetical protein
MWRLSLNEGTFFFLLSLSLLTIDQIDCLFSILFNITGGLWTFQTSNSCNSTALARYSNEEKEQMSNPTTRLDVGRWVRYVGSDWISNMVTLNAERTGWRSWDVSRLSSIVMFCWNLIHYGSCFLMLDDDSSSLVQKGWRKCWRWREKLIGSFSHCLSTTSR